MTIRKIIAHVDAIKPNAFDDAAKVQWLNEAEGYIQTEIMMIALVDVLQYDPETNMDTEMLVKPPHDKIYTTYLTAMVDFANGEYNKYNNTMQMYNKFLGEYISWYARTYRPADGKCAETGYYLSAYGIALKHGFEGTEEEWLEALRGDPGPQGKPFTYEDFTPDQLEALRGPQGDVGPKGDAGVFVKEEPTDEPAEDDVVEVDLTEEADDPDIYIPDSLTREGDFVFLMCDGEKMGEPFEIHDGEDGADGANGKDGADGKNFTILGYYDSLDTLKSVVTDPEPGDAYGIGTEAPYNAWVFDGVTQDWIDNGPLSGVAGADGVGIKSIEQTTVSDEDGGTNVITITMTDSATYTFSVKNGSKGSAGYTPQKDVDYFDGTDGYTPVRGKDYWTEEDQQTIIDEVLANFTDATEVAM